MDRTIIKRSTYYSSWFLTKPAPSVKYLLTRLFSKKETPRLVIDLGCGNLRNIIPFLKYFPSIKVIGVDKINIFNKKWPLRASFVSIISKNYSNQFTFIQNDLENLELYDKLLPKTSDIILCNYVFQNLNPHLYPMLLEKIHEKNPRYFAFDFYSNNKRKKGEIVQYRGQTWYTPKDNHELERLLTKKFEILWKKLPSSSNSNTSRAATWSYLLKPLTRGLIEYW